MCLRGILPVLLGLGLTLACGGSGHDGGLTNPGQPPSTNTATGKVTYKGAPLPGVQVSLFDTNNNIIAKTAVTDANGAYAFAGLEATGDVPEEYLIWASAPGYGFYPTPSLPGRAVRTGQNAMLLGNKVDDIGMNLTAIDYVSTVAGGSLSGADFAAYDGTNARVALSRTGQTRTYAPGDDGDALQGLSWPPARFTDNQDGTVTDQATGLVWLKNAGALGQATWSAAITAATQLASGAAGLADGSKAGDWRLPNLNELESLVDVSASGPALTPGNPFTGVSTGIYWTSTSYWGGSAGSPSAWAIRMGDGRYVNDGATNLKTAANAVWAVRGAGSGPGRLRATGFWITYQPGDDGSIQAGVGLTCPRFLDNADGTVTDTMTGLVWLKQANAILLPWDQALAAVNALASGQCGLTDGSVAGQWRMPNRKEMQSLSDRMQPVHFAWFNYTYYGLDGSVFQAPIFSDFQATQYYWTSSTDAADPTQAWTVYSCDYGVYDMPKTAVGFTLAVR
jgi:hypothetical protein